ncbi:hypothetical protein WA026_012634 [Henosepilachna vigintioctopunctata]|uniref:L-lactate dehydrogenase n=1 Tax=Henosepilachna vigintioctopunctata TaxID=420089 RepID=A0AAW1U0B5_9CUCU
MIFLRRILQKNHNLFRYFTAESCSAENENTEDKLLMKISCQDNPPSDKITVVGVGSVGVAVAFAIVSQNISNNIVLVDADQKRLCGERLDLQQGSTFKGNYKIEACTDYTKTACSKVCVITAGVRQKPEESRLKLVQRNADIMKEMIPKLVKYSPDTTLLLVTNPVDVMSYVSWKISGLPNNKVFGSGTHLDSSRFRFFLSEKFGVSPCQCHGYIVGEHGDSSVALWSSVNVAGVRLRELNPKAGTDEDDEKWADIHKKVVRGAYEVIKLKGYTSWAIGLTAASIVNSILRRAPHCQTVSINAKGLYGISEDLYLSLPALINSNGISHVVKKNLDCEEQDKLMKSAKTLEEIQKSVKI